MNIDRIERRNNNHDVATTTTTTTTTPFIVPIIYDHSERIEKLQSIDLSQGGQQQHQQKASTTIKKSGVRQELRTTTSIYKGNIYLLFICFLCGMRLSVDFVFQYYRILPTGTTYNNYNTNGSITTTDYSTILYETIQSQFNEAQSAFVQEAERTSNILRQSVYNSITTTAEPVSSQSIQTETGNDDTNVIQVKHTDLYISVDDNYRNNTDYAYAYVIGGCDPTTGSYRGFIYNILVSAKLLRDKGSTNDVVAFFQMSYSYTSSMTLPESDVRALRGLDIHIYYIPPSPYESFYETVMNKFRILQLTQYKRIILMDGDVMPLSNIDFLFDLSNDNIYGAGNSTLKENVVVAGPWEPANAGFFMLAPKIGDYEQIVQIIALREKRVVQVKGNDTLFDEHEGWGHVIEAPDQWVSRKDRGTEWTFHFAFSDQGLLYHWTKYVQKSVSIVFNQRVENLSQDSHGNPYLERELQQPFVNYSKPLISVYRACSKFMCDYFHFTGKQKPWLRKPPLDLSEKTKFASPANIWWYYLQMVDQELSLQLNFDDWVSPGRPSLGLFATWKDMKKKKAYQASSDDSGSST